MRRAPDFKPGNLRRLTGSSSAVYSAHCLLGGHPRQIARYLLPGSPWRTSDGSLTVTTTDGAEVTADIRALLLADALQHAYETVLAALEALDTEAIDALGPLEKTVTARTGDLLGRLARWRDNDLLARVGTIGV
jgi:hypothetical protein